MSNSKKRTAAAIARLVDTFPATFFIDPARRAPPKVGIAGDMAAAGVIPLKELRFALMVYCSSAGYLRSLKQDAARLDLAGNEAGIVTADEAEHARRKLDEVLAKRQPKPPPVPQQRREGPAAQERAPRKQQAAGVDCKADSQRCETPALAQQSGSEAGRREIGVTANRNRTQPAKDRDGFAALRAAAARRREAAGVA